MKIDTSKQRSTSAPVIFSDGTEFFGNLANKYRAHSKGLFILAPSGSGKTHYIKAQKSNDWIDGDDIWVSAGAQPKSSWWLWDLEDIYKVERKCDVITEEARDMGFWILGSADYSLRPDAVVIPPWDIHRKYIKLREENHYDGGATSDDYAQVINHRKFINSWAKKGVPKFECVEDAVEYLVMKGDKL
jgi:hypothetical protein